MKYQTTPTIDYQEWEEEMLLNEYVAAGYRGSSFISRSRYECSVEGHPTITELDEDRLPPHWQVS